MPTIVVIVKTYQDEKNKFEASLTAYIPRVGSAILLAAADYTSVPRCVKEGFLLVESQSIQGLCIATSYDSREVPLEYRPLIPPPIEKELAWGAEWALAKLITTIFNQDRELSRDISLLWDRPRQQLSERDILMIYLRGTYGDSFRQVQNKTQCSALRAFLTDILAIPPFKIENEQSI